MDLVHFIVTLAVIGTLLWVVNTYLPMDRKVKKILNIVVVVSVVLWVGNLFGVFDFVRNIRIGK